MIARQTKQLRHLFDCRELSSARLPLLHCRICHHHHLVVPDFYVCIGQFHWVCCLCNCCRWLTITHPSKCHCCCLRQHHPLLGGTGPNQTNFEQTTSACKRWPSDPQSLHCHCRHPMVYLSGLPPPPRGCSCCCLAPPLPLPPPPLPMCKTKMMTKMQCTSIPGNMCWRTSSVVTT
jgi:hypothetical protein